jgi:ketosteroid isomerase-like protein
MSATAQLDTALKAADDAFFEALLAADVAALEQVLAAEFAIVDVAAGSVFRREEFLGGIAAGAVRFESIERFHDEALVRELGEGAGVVVGRTAMTFLTPDGTKVEAASRYTHVFRADGERWQLFSAQGTRIVDGPAL